VLPIHGLKVKISKSMVDHNASAVLQPAWIKIYSVPGFAKEEDIIREITTLVAEPIKVDEFSLLRDEPVRVRVNCRDPSKLKRIVEIFFNGVGYDVQFMAEGVQGKTQGKGDGPPGNQNRHGDGSSRRKGKDEDNDVNRRRLDSHDNEDGSTDKELEASQGESQEDSMEDLIRDGSPNEEVMAEMTVPLAAYHPDFGIVRLEGKPRQDNEEGTEAANIVLSVVETFYDHSDSFYSPVGDSVTKKNLITGAVEETVTQDSQTSGISTPGQHEPPEQRKKDLPVGKILVHNQEGEYFLDANKWPTLKIVDTTQDPILTQ